MTMLRLSECLKESIGLLSISIKPLGTVVVSVQRVHRNL